MLDGDNSDEEDDDSESDEETPKKVLWVNVTVVIFLYLFYCLNILSLVEHRWHDFDSLVLAG